MWDASVDSPSLFVWNSLQARAHRVAASGARSPTRSDCRRGAPSQNTSGIASFCSVGSHSAPSASASLSMWGQTYSGDAICIDLVSVVSVALGASGPQVGLPGTAASGAPGCVQRAICAVSVFAVAPLVKPRTTTASLAAPAGADQALGVPRVDAHLRAHVSVWFLSRLGAAGFGRAQPAGR